MATPEWVPGVFDRPEGRITFKAEAYEDNGRVVCAIFDAEGERFAGPHEFAKAVREEIEKFEALVKSLGAQEVRIGGRWCRHIVSGYEPYPIPSDPLLRRKILDA